MSIYLNAYPLLLNITHPIKVACLDYSEERLKKLKEIFGEKYMFRRNGNRILCFSANNKYEDFEETLIDIDLNKDEGVLIFLIKNAFKRLIDSVGSSKSFGFSPIQLLSSKQIQGITPDSEFPFSVVPKYEFDVKNIGQHLCLVCDNSVKFVTRQNAEYFHKQGLDLIGKSVYVEIEMGVRQMIGKIVSIVDNVATYENNVSSIQTVDLKDVFIDASNNTVSEFLELKYGTKASMYRERIMSQIKLYNSGDNKITEIEKIISFFRKRPFNITDSIDASIGEKLDISHSVKILDRPQFLFGQNNVSDWTDRGIKQFGPYTKSTFDRNNPSICVICSQSHQGAVEQFVQKFLHGLKGHKAYDKGFEDRFCVGCCKVKTYTFANETPEDYKKTIDRAIADKAEEGAKWDLALVQLYGNFKSLKGKSNPYFIAKSKLIAQEIPVQGFLIDLLNTRDYNLGYSLNNLALATYAKMGGSPWLLRSSETVAHEIVLGIGSASIYDDGRVMGITTVFTGDGRYIISNKSKAVMPEHYRDELTNTLQDTILKLKCKLNVMDGDTIRIIFHSTVKKFNKYEIDAVIKVINNFSQYKIEYAFVKISQNHLLELFDTSKEFAPKGKYSPTRGQIIHISDMETMLCLKGGEQLKTPNSGHPKCILVSLHPGSTFRDIAYLSRQIYNFSFQSWRSYFPSSLPVTILYSDLIAFYLGIFKSIPTWDEGYINNRAGTAKWFL